MHRIFLYLTRPGLALLLTLGFGEAAFAQVATPAGTPVAVTCDITPRPIDFIVTLLEADAPETTPTVVANVPAGTPADPETAAAVLTVIEELTACVNGGDYLRAFALYDDAYLRRLIDPEGLMDPAVAVEIGKSLSIVVPGSEEDITRITQVISTVMLADGTVALAVETSGGVDREQDDAQIDLFVLADVSGSWLIVDSAADVDLSPATPTA